MRTPTVALFALSLFTLSACAGPESLTSSNPAGSPGGSPIAGPGGTGGTGGSADPAGDFPFGDPGDSPSGGTTERQQGFLGWKLEVLPSGELQLRFRQTGLTVSSFSYVVGAVVEGDVQCYNKADNAPQGQPFHFSINASATLGAQSVNGTIDATVATNVLQGACGNTQFEARPDTTARPFQWTGVYLDNPQGRLPLPDIKLGDAPLGFYASN